MTNNQDDRDTRLKQSVQAALRDSETPDGAVRARLAAMRRRALDRPSRSIAWPWAALGGAVAASVLAVMIAVHEPESRMDSAAHRGDLAQVDLLESLTEDDDPLQEADLYEDLDVLTWLSGEDERA